MCDITTVSQQVMCGVRCSPTAVVFLLNVDMYYEWSTRLS